MKVVCEIIIRSEEMPRTQDCIFLITLTVEIITGILGNGLIGVVNCIDWVRHRKLNFINCILTGLSLTRICFFITILADSFLTVFSADVHGFGQVRKINIHFGIVASYLTVWFDTCLSIFYFFKIATFSHRLFVWMKWRVNKVVVIYFVGSFLLLLIMIPMMNDSIPDALNLEANNTWKIKLNETQTVVCLVFGSVGVICPTVISIASFLFLLLSLWRHVRRMKFSSTGSRDLSTEAHVKVMRIVVSRLFLFLIYIGVILGIICCQLLFPSRFILLFNRLVISVHPLIHSFIIILENSKMKQAAFRILRQLLCFVTTKC